MQEELYLIYVNNLGSNYEGNNVLEFIFSDVKKDVDGEDWDAIPSSGRPEPPYKNFIKKIGVLETDIDFLFAQDSSCFCLWDAMDGILPLVFEDISSHTTYPEHRIIIHFGKTLEEVNNLLYERDLILNYKK